MRFGEQVTGIYGVLKKPNPALVAVVMSRSWWRHVPLTLSSLAGGEEIRIATLSIIVNRYNGKLQ